MNCGRMRRLVQGYVDRELDLGAALALEEHLASCGDCRAYHDALRRVRAAVGAGLGSEPAPAALRARIAQSIGSPPHHALAWWQRPAAWLAVPAMLLLVFASLLAGLAYQQWAVTGEERVVYHINENTDPATALRNLANLVDIRPEVKAVVVAHNKGVDFLLAGARDDTGEPYERSVAGLRGKGIEFRVCGNTLARRAIDPRQVIAAATLVPSGIAEIGRLQTREHYAYVRL